MDVTAVPTSADEARREQEMLVERGKQIGEEQRALQAEYAQLSERHTFLAGWLAAQDAKEPVEQ